MKSIDVLIRVNGLDDFIGVDLYRQRQLNKNAMYRWIVVELRDQGEQFGLAGAAGQPVIERLHAALHRHLLFAGYIGFARRVVAHQHYGQPRPEAVCCNEALHLRGDLGAQLGRGGLSIDQHRRHLAATSRISSNAATTAPTSPLISIRLRREAAPPISVMLLGAMRSVRATSRTSAPFASPPLGAALTRAFKTAWPSAKCAMPSIASRPALGVRRTVTTNPSALTTQGLPPGSIANRRPSPNLAGRPSGQNK